MNKARSTPSPVCAGWGFPFSPLLPYFFSVDGRCPEVELPIAKTKAHRNRESGTIGPVTSKNDFPKVSAMLINNRFDAERI